MLLAQTVRAFKAKLQGKSLAYHRVFDRNSPYAHEVLADLARFCRAHESTFHADARLHAVLEGRREVWLKIEKMLNLSPDELYTLHRVKEIGHETSPNSAPTI